MKTMYLGCSLALATLLAACAKEPLDVTGAQGQTVTMVVGQELRLTVGTVGPGEYEAPPTISSPALTFIDAAVVGPYVPSGPTQLFRFRAESSGRVLVVISHSGNNPTIQDTVVIR